MSLITPPGTVGPGFNRVISTPGTEEFAGPPFPVTFVSPVGNAAGYPLNNGAPFGPDTPGTTTCGIQEAINSLPGCTVFDASNNFVAGQAGYIFLLPGIFRTSSMINVPPGNIRIEGPNTQGGALNLGTYGPNFPEGGAIVLLSGVSVSQPFALYVNVDGTGNPATYLIMRNIHFKVISPAANVANSGIVRLQGWWTGVVEHITAQELNAGGGTGTHLAAAMKLDQQALTSLKRYANIQTNGCNIGHQIACDHIHVESTSAAFTGGSAFFGAGFDAGYYILPQPQMSFRNMAAFSCSFGFAMGGAGVAQPLVFDTFMWESCGHYLYTPTAITGAVKFNRPILMGGVNPTTDIAGALGGSAPNLAAGTGLVCLSTDEFVPGATLTAGMHMAAPGYSGASITTPASPGQIGPFQYPCRLLVTTAGAATVVALNGVTIGTSLTVNQLISLDAGDWLTVTWATTAPVFTIIPT